MREKLIELIRKADKEDHESLTQDVHYAFMADNLIANGVAIPVRCKDCEHWCYEYDDVGLCTTDVPDIDGVQRRADDFCSYGERRTDG